MCVMKSSHQYSGFVFWIVQLDAEFLFGSHWWRVFIVVVCFCVKH